MSFSLSLGLGFGNATARGSSGASTPTIFFSSGATDKHPNVTLSNGNLTMTPTGASGYEGARVTAVSVPAKYQFEVTIASDFNFFAVGIENGTENFATSNEIPGNDNSTGVAIQRHAGTFYKDQGGPTAAAANPTPSAGVITVAADEAAGTVSFRCDGTLIDTLTGVTFSDWKAFVSDKGNVATINLTGPFVYPQSGYSPYDS